MSARARIRSPSPGRRSRPRAPVPCWSPLHRIGDGPGLNPSHPFAPVDRVLVAVWRCSGVGLFRLERAGYSVMEGPSYRLELPLTSATRIGSTSGLWTVQYQGVVSIYGSVHLKLMYLHESRSYIRSRDGPPGEGRTGMHMGRARPHRQHKCQSDRYITGVHQG